MEHAKSRTRRCAMYTRKSSEEGLEQDFNSLQAQREACEAFMKLEIIDHRMKSGGRFGRQSMR